MTPEEFAALQRVVVPPRPPATVEQSTAQLADNSAFPGSFIEYEEPFHDTPEVFSTRDLLEIMGCPDFMADMIVSGQLPFDPELWGID